MRERDLKKKKKAFPGNQNTFKCSVITPLCPFPKSTPSQLLLYVKQQIGKTKKKARGPTKWGSTESLEHSQVS